MPQTYFYDLQVYKISRNTKTSLNGRKKIYSKYLEKHNKHVRVLWDHKFPTFVTQYMFRNQNIKNTKYIIMIAECFISDHYHLLRKSACIYLKQVSYLWKDRHHFYIFKWILKKLKGFHPDLGVFRILYSDLIFWW